MNHKEVLFSVNEYDLDGDCTDYGIFLHFGSTRIKAAENLQDFKEMVDHLEMMISEIEENYPKI